MYDPERGYPIVVPCVLYDDPVDAVGWLTDVLDFREAVRATLPDGWVGHIEMERAGFIILLGRRGEESGDASSLTQVFVADVDASCERAIAGGGTLVDPPGSVPGVCGKPWWPTLARTGGCSRSMSGTQIRATGTARSFGSFPAESSGPFPAELAV
jgi:predicted enzyme related to lactoylglutathione lyase